MRLIFSVLIATALVCAGWIAWSRMLIPPLAVAPNEVADAPHLALDPERSDAETAVDRAMAEMLRQEQVDDPIQAMHAAFEDMHDLLGGLFPTTDAFLAPTDSRVHRALRLAGDELAKALIASLDAHHEAVDLTGPLTSLVVQGDEQGIFETHLKSELTNRGFGLSVDDDAEREPAETTAVAHLRVRVAATSEDDGLAVLATAEFIEPSGASTTWSDAAERLVLNDELVASASPDELRTILDRITGSGATLLSQQGDLMARRFEEHRRASVVRIALLSGAALLTIVIGLLLIRSQRRRQRAEAWRREERAEVVVARPVTTLVLAAGGKDDRAQKLRWEISRQAHSLSDRLLRAASTGSQECRAAMTPLANGIRRVARRAENAIAASSPVDESCSELFAEVSRAAERLLSHIEEGHSDVPSDQLELALKFASRLDRKIIERGVVTGQCG